MVRNIVGAGRQLLAVFLGLYNILGDRVVVSPGLCNLADMVAVS